MNYSVDYGVNNGHINECELFELYRDAKKFYENLDAKYQAKICFKLFYGDKVNVLGKCVVDKEAKLFSFESGTDNTLMLESLIIK